MKAASETGQRKKRTEDTKQKGRNEENDGDEMEAASSNDDEGEEEEEAIISESTSRIDPYAADKATGDDEESIEERLKNVDEEESKQMKRKRELEERSMMSAVCIDPEKVLEVGERSEKKLRSKLRLNVSTEDQSSEDDDDDEQDEESRRTNEERQRKLIQEAFAGDDVVEDFIREQKEKDASERAAEREAALKQKGLDGDWVTPNNIFRLDDRKKKFLESRKKLFQPKAAIINEDADTKGIKKLRASDLPKGFNKVSQFEVSKNFFKEK